MGLWVHVGGTSGIILVIFWVYPSRQHLSAWNTWHGEEWKSTKISALKDKASRCPHHDGHEPPDLPQVCSPAVLAGHVIGG
jgi:hypothetical protein